MKSAPEKAVRAVRSLSRVLCAAALVAPLAAAQPAESRVDADAAAWLERAADEARTISGRGPGLTAALRDKGRLLAQAGGLGAAGDAVGSNTGGADRWFALAELCERALTHRNANGPVTAALVEGLARAGRVDDAAKRIETLADGPDRDTARAALARALALHTPDDPRAAKLRAGADPAGAPVWAPAFVEAGDFDGLEQLVAGADLTNGHRAALLAGLAEAQARSGDRAAARHSLDEALALGGGEAGDDLALALAGAHAALGRVDDAAAAVDTLQGAAARIRGLSRLAAARAASGDPPGALSDLQAAAELAGRSTDAGGLPGAARELARVAADRGRAAETGRWLDTLGDPRLRAAAALGLAEGLSDRDLRPRMTQALRLPGAQPATPTEAPIVAAEPDAAGAAELSDEPPAGAPGVTVVPRAANAADVATAETVPPAAEKTDAAADAAGAKLNGTAERAIEDAMTELPGGPVATTDTPEAAPRRVATSKPWPDLPRAQPAARAAVTAGVAATTPGSAASRLTARPRDTASADASSDETPDDLTGGGSGANTRPAAAHAERDTAPDADPTTAGVTDPAGSADTPEAGSDVSTGDLAAEDPPLNADAARDGTATAGTANPDTEPSDGAEADRTHAPATADAAEADPRADNAVAGEAGFNASGEAAGKTPPPTTPLADRADAPADIVRAIDEPSGAVGDATAPETAAAASGAAATDPVVTDSAATPPAIENAGAAPAAAGRVVAVPNLRRLANPDDPQFSDPAPAVYDARFITTRGAFTLRVHRAWAPGAADRFYQLCRAGFYNNNRFFRAVPGFVVQWGIHGFPSVATSWRNAAIPDEPVRERNRRGTVSFAAAAVPNTRTTQVFINLADNAFLDDLGFAPFAEVVDGMGVVEQLFSGYGEAPSQLQRRIQLDGNAFLDENYPNLDGVVGVEISTK